MVVEERARIGGTFHIACIFLRGEVTMIGATGEIGERPLDLKSCIDQILIGGDDSVNYLGRLGVVFQNNTFLFVLSEIL
jgi:hypothetical protein